MTASGTSVGGVPVVVTRPGGESSLAEEQMKFTADDRWQSPRAPGESPVSVDIPRDRGAISQSLELRSALASDWRILLREDVINLPSLNQ